MSRKQEVVARICALAIAASSLWLAVGPAPAQTSSAPPPLPTASPGRPAAPKPAPPRPAIQLSPAERQAIDAAAQASQEKPARVEDALAPTAEDIKPRAADDASTTTRIEQTRVSNRVSEVIVTPAGQWRSYVMTNREGQQPFGQTQMNSGLSVPMFFRIELGRSTPPAANPPPPPAPSPSR